MPSGRHATLHGFGLGDVDNVVEQVCFSVLPSEVLQAKKSGQISNATMVKGGEGWGKKESVECPPDL